MQTKGKEKVMIKEVISYDYDTCVTFNKFFTRVVPNLKKIPSGNLETSFQYQTEDPIQSTINKLI